MVSVCTPHPAHADGVVAAAGAGAHVLVEKPLAADLASCDRAIAAGRAAGVRIGVVSQRRWYRPVVRLRRAIDDGRIGRPVLATATVLGWRDAAYYRSDPWRGRWSTEGGGVLVNQAPHQLDLLLWLLGPVEEVYGRWANFSHPSIEVEDTAVGVVRFRSGALASLVLSNAQDPGLYGRIHVHGSNGATVGVQTDGGSMFIAGVTAAVDPPVNDVWTVRGEEDLLAGWQAADRAAAFAEDPLTFYHARQIEDFLVAIVEDRAPAVDAEDGRRVVELFTAVYRSQRDGRPVAFPLAAEDGDDFDGRLAARATGTGGAGRAVKALVLAAYNRLELVDLPLPAVGPRDVLVRVRACGICGSDVHGLDGSTGRRIPPIVMGHEAAGEIAGVGPEVDGWRIGDRVTFDSTISCGRLRHVPLRPGQPVRPAAGPGCLVRGVPPARGVRRVRGDSPARGVPAPGRRLLRGRCGRRTARDRPPRRLPGGRRGGQPRRRGRDGRHRVPDRAGPPRPRRAHHRRRGPQSGPPGAGGAARGDGHRPERRGRRGRPGARRDRAGRCRRRLRGGRDRADRRPRDRVGAQGRDRGPRRQRGAGRFGCRSRRW